MLCAWTGCPYVHVPFGPIAVRSSNDAMNDWKDVDITTLVVGLRRGYVCSMDKFALKSCLFEAQTLFWQMHGCCYVAVMARDRSIYAIVNWSIGFRCEELRKSRFRIDKKNVLWCCTLCNVVTRAACKLYLMLIVFALKVHTMLLLSRSIYLFQCLIYELNCKTSAGANAYPEWYLSTTVCPVVGALALLRSCWWIQVNTSSNTQMWTNSRTLAAGNYFLILCVLGTLYAFELLVVCAPNFRLPETCAHVFAQVSIALHFIGLRACTSAHSVTASK